LKGGKKKKKVPMKYKDTCVKNHLALSRQTGSLINGWGMKFGRVIQQQLDEDKKNRKTESGN